MALLYAASCLLASCLDNWTMQVPVRIALTLGTAPLVDKYIIKPFNLDKKGE